MPNKRKCLMRVLRLHRNKRCPHSRTKRRPKSHSIRIRREDRNWEGHHDRRSHRRLKLLKIENKNQSINYKRTKGKRRKRTHIDVRARQPARVLPRTRRLPQRAKIVRRIRLCEARHGRTAKQRSRRRHGDHVEHATRMRRRRRALRVLLSSRCSRARRGCARRLCCPCRCHR